MTSARALFTIALVALAPLPATAGPLTDKAAEVEALPGWIYHLIDQALDCPIQGGLIVPPVEMDGHLCIIWITRSSPKASPESRLG